MYQIAVFVSGGGTNLQAIMDQIADGRLPDVRIACVVASRAGCQAEQRARRAGIPTHVVCRGDYDDLSSFDRAMLSVLAPYSIDLVVLAGFLCLLGPDFVAAYPGHIINVHPSLIPAFCGPGYYGIRPHEAALAYGVRITGATVHIVDAEYDHGPIILQKAVPVLPDDTPQTLQQRVMIQAEQKILPQAIALFAAGRIEQEGRKIRIKKEKKAMKKAIISVSDKTGLPAFCRELVSLGYELISTGGTAALLQREGLKVTAVSDVTDFPECLDGRVKTLHPRIHAGILARRDNPKHLSELKELCIDPIDLVVVNLYPFRRTIQQPGVDFETCIENIDIGGPSLLRAAAKNCRDVTVLVDPADYDLVLDEIKREGETSEKTRLRLARKVFEHTAAYDAVIARYFATVSPEPEWPDQLTFAYDLIDILRYGENPHQRGVFYRDALPVSGSLTEAEQLNGKELSYNNIADTDAAIAVLREFSDPTVVAVKHANPCGVGSAEDLLSAWKKAYDADPVSIYGGIVAFNRTVDLSVAQATKGVFLEVMVAPDYTPDALSHLRERKNLRVLRLPDIAEPLDPSRLAMKPVYGGMLVQDQDLTVFDPEKCRVVTKAQPDPSLSDDLEFAMKVVKHVKSNAIVLAKNVQTVGIGPGQPNRITSLQIAIRQAGEKAAGSVLASDAFFPFSDCVKAAAAAGIAAIIQPGGSVRDQESIDACDEAGLPMIFTGVRHFKH